MSQAEERRCAREIAGESSCPSVDDSGGCSRRVPAHPVAYFTRQNPFSRFTGATGARACKSNARCPLVNLRINTHRADNLRSQCIHSVPALCPSPFLLLLFFPSALGAGRFSDRYLPADCARCPGRREPRQGSSLYPLALRSLRPADVDTPIISRGAARRTLPIH